MCTKDAPRLQRRLRAALGSGEKAEGPVGRPTEGGNFTAKRKTTMTAAVC